MNLGRRDFLKWSGLAAVGAVACNIFDDQDMQIQSPVLMPEDLVTGKDNWYATLCGQCPEREGILVRVMEGRAKKVRGNPLYPTNQGSQSARCEGGLQALYHPDRIEGPLERVPGTARGSGQFQSIPSWEVALDRLAARLRPLRDGNPSAMLMVTEPLRGHLGLVVNRFVEAYGGRPPLAFEPLDQRVLRASVKRVFDQDRLPNFDIENASYVLSFGADFLSTWVSPVRYARGYGEFRGDRGGKGRGTLVHADPRYSMTAANADEWIPILPGKEGMLALSMMQVILLEGLADPGVADAMTGGAGASLLEAYRPEKVWGEIGIPEFVSKGTRKESAPDLIKRIAKEFTDRRPSLAFGGGDATGHTHGISNMSAVFALNYLVGSVGKKPGEGGIVFNPPSPIDDLPPTTPASSLEDWQKVVDDINSGQIEVLMVHGANPVYGLPVRLELGGALERDDLFIVSFSSFMDDTTQMADLVLPERNYLEDWGDDIPDPGPGYQVVGIQQPVVNPLTELDPRSFPDMLLTLSQELGLDDGLSDTFEAILKDGARKLFDLKRGSVQETRFTAFWNKLLQQGGWWDTSELSKDQAPDPPDLADLLQLGVRPAFKEPPGRGKLYHLVPFLSNSILDGRGAHIPWLQAAPDPLTTVTWQTWVEINAQEARRMGLKEGDEVSLVAPEGYSIKVAVYPHPAVPTDVVGVPIGQGHSPGLQYADKDGKQRGENPLSILAPETVRGTGSFAWGATLVSIRPTDRSSRVSKFEGIVPAFPIGTKEEDIVHVTNKL